MSSSPVCGPSNTVLRCVSYRIEVWEAHGGKTHRSEHCDDEDAKAFYADILGLNLVMDLGWILTFAGTEAAAPRISIATGGIRHPSAGSLHRGG